MPTDKFRQKNPKNKQTKFQLVFDEGSRSDFLSGFQKRKKARKKIALQEVEEKRKKERREERQKRRDALEEELKSIRLPDPTPATEKKEDVVFDHPEHTVTVTTSLDLNKAHGGIGENEVDYAEPELDDDDDEKEGLAGVDYGDVSDQDGDDADILRRSKNHHDDDDDDEEESEDEETNKIKEVKSKKKEIFNKRRQKIKKQMMKKKRGVSQQSAKRMKSMKKKSLGKFIKRGSANKAKR